MVTQQPLHARPHVVCGRVTTVTDDWMDTEAAAVARDRMAAESQFRKAAEQEKIRQENDAMKERLSKVKSLTDDDISDEQAVRARGCDSRACATLLAHAAHTDTPP